jgi:hypothetical protein
MTDDELKGRLQALIDTYVQDERAAVVAWLLGLFPDNVTFSFMLNGVARRIACGEHRREEEP